MSREPFTPAELPLLGEPLPLELANTWYRAGPDRIIDFLADAETMEAWFAHAPGAAAFELPAPLSNAVMADIRQLRDAVRTLCDYRTGTGGEPTGSVAVLNCFARRAPMSVVLTWDGATSPRATTHHLRATPAEVLLAALATEAIELFAGPDLERVRRCATPGCEMLFLLRHHRRRFCSAPCSHRTRQARYYQASSRSPA